MTEPYVAVRMIRPGKYAGTIRDVLSASEMAECTHAHKTRSAALRCAESLIRFYGSEG